MVALSRIQPAMPHGSEHFIPRRSDQPASDLPRIHLASTSPRRRELLAAAGIEFDAAHPGLDDGQLAPGSIDPERWVMALAYLKAASALHTKSVPGACIILGADTIVVQDGRTFGQPTDAADARRMLVAMRNADHDVLTGVALIDPRTGAREIFADRAIVHVGHISDDEIERYIASDLWRGKAGAYNLSERLAAGWPITFEGDPGTIMGLPMRMLPDRLRAFASRAA